MRVKNYVDNYSDTEVKEAINFIKAAKETENSTQGLLSKTADFRSVWDKTFLFGTGATVSIIGEKIAKSNNLVINRLDKLCNIVEASGANPDIIGYCQFYVKLAALGKIKRLKCLVVQGNKVDREILICIQVLKKLDLIHPTFGRVTVSNYIKRLIQIKDSNVAVVYEKSNIKSDDHNTRIPSECTKMRNKILCKFKDISKTSWVRGQDEFPPLTTWR